MLNSFLIALNAVLPLMLYLALGFFLVRTHIVQEDFMQALNRFTFKVLFPFMMFNNVYAASPGGPALDEDHLWHPGGDRLLSHGAEHGQRRPAGRPAGVHQHGDLAGDHLLLYLLPEPAGPAGPLNPAEQKGFSPDSVCPPEGSLFCIVFWGETPRSFTSAFQSSPSSPPRRPPSSTMQKPERPSASSSVKRAGFGLSRSSTP